MPIPTDGASSDAAREPSLIAELSASSDKFVLASELIKGRERLGLTQAQLAAASHVSLSAIKGYETGRNFPGARELRQLCQALRLSPNKVLFGVETPFPEEVLRDPASHPGQRGAEISRSRVSILMQFLAADECRAVYTIVQAIAVARHGSKEVDGLVELADLATGLKTLKSGEPLDQELFRAILKDPRVASEAAAALRAAADAAKASRQRADKVSKK